MDSADDLTAMIDATDPAVVARLLVFANELEDDAKAIGEQAAQLKRSLLMAYRNNVIERGSLRAGHRA